MSPGRLPGTRRARARRGRLEGRWTEAQGLRVFYRASVDPAAPGPVVVLVHGLGLSSRYLLPVGELLAPDHPVYGPDLPGYGLSDDPGRVLPLPDLADALAAWMEAAALPPAVLLANSFGCQIAVELAVRRPDLVAGLILQGPTTDPHHRTLLQQTIRWRLNTHREPPGMGEIARRDYRRAGLRRVWGTWRLMLADRIEEKLPHVSAPTLVVRGSRDPIATAEWAEEAARTLPRGRLVTVPGVSHTMVFSFPLELARVSRPFLREVGARGEAGPA